MYSHDGLRDSLTQLAAPTFFYEELKRELARADRQNEPISLIRFLLRPVDSMSKIAEPISDSRYEEEIVSFAQTLTRLCRDEDVCARMGELEFVCILRGTGFAASRLISRISFSWREDLARRGCQSDSESFLLETSSVVSHPLESALKLLNRLDSE